MDKKIRIAISGGGMAGATLLHALLPHEHLDVHIFESAAAFKEAGAAVGITRNALASLDLIGPSAMQCLDRAGAVLQKSARVTIAEGPDQGKFAYELKDGSEEKRLSKVVHRAAFLKELLSNVPEARMHASKRLDRVDRQADGSVRMFFSDGTTHDCDILVGADGIRSVVRGVILGQEDPAALPRNSGWWAVWTLQPYEEARSLLGEDRTDINDPREYIFIGDGTFLMHNVLSGGELVQFVITNHDEDEVGGSKWQRTVLADKIRELYQGSLPHLSNAVDKLLCKEPEQPAIYLWDHPPARTYVSGPLCIMGDAAHATTPWLSSGGGMSIEDSLLLSSLLSRSKTPAQALGALKAYDEVRRPRTQRIVESSRVMGWLATGKDEEVGLQAEGIGRKMTGFFNFIHDLEIQKHLDEAIALMDRNLATQSLP